MVGDSRAVGSAAIAPYARLGAIGTVGVGGALGAAAREAVAQLLRSHSAGFPWSTFAVNISGAFLLGIVLEALSRWGDDERLVRQLRLLLGTGFMGGYTTYSTLAVETVELGHHGRWGLSAAYVTASVTAGLLATWSGIALAGLRAVGRKELPVDPDADCQAAR